MLVFLLRIPSFVCFSHEANWAVAVPPAASSAEQTGPASLHLYSEEHPVEPLFSELWRRGLHTGFQPEPSLQVANGNETLQSAALLHGSTSPRSERSSSFLSFHRPRPTLTFDLARSSCSNLRVFVHVQAGQQGRCGASYTSPGPVRLVHQGCISTHAYRLRYCGQCSGSPCCVPHRTSTPEVAFRCLTGALIRRPVMMIHSCVCSDNCPNGPFLNPALKGFRP